MTALVAAELLKLRTTRAWIGYAAALVALTAIGVAATVGTADADLLDDGDFQADLFSGFSELIALLLGITSVTWEWRHGTITPTFLATPRRERVVAAKLAAGCVVGAAAAVVGILVVVAVAAPWLAAEGAGLELDAGVWSRAGRILLATVLYGALGVGVGSVVHSQVGALVGAIVWLLLAENLVALLLGLADVEGAADVLPGRALAALEGSVGPDEGLSAWGGAAAGLGWVVLLTALGLARTRRRDVT